MSSAGRRIRQAVNGASDFVSDTARDVRANDVYDWASNVAGSAANVTTGGLFDLATGGEFSVNELAKDVINTGTAGGVHAHEKAILDPRREAEQAERKAIADAERARATGIAALPKDPTIEEIQRQRAARGGRRGTILTAPGTTLGGTSGKKLLGL